MSKVPLWMHEAALAEIEWLRDENSRLVTERTEGEAEIKRLRRIDYEEIERVAKLEAEIERLRADLAWCREQGEMQDRVIVKLTAALREIAALPHTICHSVMIARAALEGK